MYTESASYIDFRAFVLTVRRWLWRCLHILQIFLVSLLEVHTSSLAPSLESAVFSDFFSSCFFSNSYLVCFIENLGSVIQGCFFISSTVGRRLPSWQNILAIKSLKSSERFSPPTFFQYLSYFLLCSRA